MLALAVAPVILVAGCGGRFSALSAVLASDTKPVIHASATRIDTNGTTQYAATLANGEAAAPGDVQWSVSGGDANAGPGTISKAGLYTPPSYLTADAVTVTVHAAPVERPTAADAAQLTVTPGFLQQLTPENLALGPNATATVSGSMTLVGGSSGIHFALASDIAGTPSEAGVLSAPHCVRGSIASSYPAYTVCTVNYTAPAAIAGIGTVYIVGTVADPAPGTPARSWTRVLLNSSGINSSPAAHQARLVTPVLLGSSSGNNSDYDAALGQLSDCCGGTLGALLQDSAGAQFVLSNNHVLARSDQAMAGETIIQPGLIDNGCTPYGFGPGTTPVATLTAYPELSAAATNVDAAIAKVGLGTVDPKGNILELGARQVDGTLAAAPPGLSSSGGKGEPAALGMLVAKSGRTTGLTCSAVSAVSVDVKVDYFTDCAETAHALTKTFTNQIAIAGTNFSDAGDSGALVVNSANAEPVGLFFAGGMDTNGVELAIANPVSDVLAALNGQSGAGYSFVGGADHPVACLSYGAAKEKNADDAAEVAELTSVEHERADAALLQAQQLVNPAAGILRVSEAVSKDRAGAAAISFTVEAGSGAAERIPARIGGVPTILAPSEAGSQVRSSALTQAMAVKQRHAQALMRGNTAIFGVGVGQSLDNASDAALILFIDRKQNAGRLPEFVEGVRVRETLMDRLHVTRSHGTPAHTSSSCPAFHEPKSFGLLD
jgi:hypothetical protein